MPEDLIDLDGSYLVVERGIPAARGVTIVERKGWGHPDTLADHLAERLSRAYARCTRREFGTVLHHNFDKLALLGGSSEVRYGVGRMIDPVRVLVNGRAARVCGGVTVPVAELITEEALAFFAERLPELRGHVAIELNITANPSPGAVLTGGTGPERSRWFSPSSAQDLRERTGLFANDTSLGTGWAPANRVEAFVRRLADHFSGPGGFRTAQPWCGSDVKVMGHGLGDELDVVLAVPQKCAHVTSRTAYLVHKEEVLAECVPVRDRHALLHADLYRENVPFTEEGRPVFLDPLPMLGDPAFDWGFFIVYFDLARDPVERLHLARRASGIDVRQLLAWSLRLCLDGLLYYHEVGDEREARMVEVMSALASEG